MNYYAAAHPAVAAASSGVTFGEIMVLIAVILVSLGTFLGKKIIDNAILGTIVQYIFVLSAGILIAAAYPQKLLVPLYHLSKGKLGVP